MGFFASLFDRIQHAYGWTDEIILDLTLRRAVQMKEAIQQREEISHWTNHKVVEWQTRILSSFISNTVDSEQGRKTLLDAAQKVSLTGASDTKKSTKIKRKRTFKLLDGTEIDIKELKNYSYHEIDHSEEDRETTERVRKKNAGMNVSDIMGSFTRIG